MYQNLSLWTKFNLLGSSLFASVLIVGDFVFSFCVFLVCLLCFVGDLILATRKLQWENMLLLFIVFWCLLYLLLVCYIFLFFLYFLVCCVFLLTSWWRDTNAAMGKVFSSCLLVLGRSPRCQPTTFQRPWAPVVNCQLGEPWHGTCKCR